MTRIAYLYVFDTMADWEPGFLTAELNSGRYFRKDAERYILRTVGLTKEPVVTMGGVRILPDVSLEECAAVDAGVLILPGGDTWLDDIHMPMMEKAKEFMNTGVLVAAICGATAGLAKAGMLDSRPHTSNDLGYLKAVIPTYKGEAFYIHKTAVTHGRLITATGIAPVDFAREVLRELGVFSSGTLDAWYWLYITHEAQYYYALMESLEI
ncbi:type 1 glutamine amidotransferase family protein [Methanolobus chelungpuianus]|uniref:Glutamine amidotransferase n=1 Tax=Methanolobus chelungpuianus TaxID=502115 RepID=A0AAE3HBU0_9EURY|nr:type 1 glutamine amidotransferase family protein [Methanolobus chelungpuianus]MCQ6962893.1 glutamine amidotransferase [Methanolobus chelungpuianus]